MDRSNELDIIGKLLDADLEQITIFLHQFHERRKFIISSEIRRQRKPFSSSQVEIKKEQTKILEGIKLSEAQNSELMVKLNEDKEYERMTTQIATAIGNSPDHMLRQYVNLFRDPDYIRIEKEIIQAYENSTDRLAYICKSAFYECIQSTMKRIKMDYVSENYGRILESQITNSDSESNRAVLKVFFDLNEQYMDLEYRMEAINSETEEVKEALKSNTDYQTILIRVKRLEKIMGAVFCEAPFIVGSSDRWMPISDNRDNFIQSEIALDEVTEGAVYKKKSLERENKSSFY